MQSMNSLPVILVCGNYGSGKSTLAAKYFAGYKRINRNEIRRFLKGMTEYGRSWEPGDFSSALETLVKHIELSIMRFYLERKEPVLIDNSSLTRKSRARYLAEAKHFHAGVGCVFLNTAVAALLERNRMRPESERVPEQVIATLFASQEPPREDEGFEAIRLIES